MGFLGTFPQLRVAREGEHPLRLQFRQAVLQSREHGSQSGGELGAESGTDLVQLLGVAGNAAFHGGDADVHRPTLRFQLRHLGDQLVGLGIQLNQFLAVHEIPHLLLGVDHPLTDLLLLLVQEGDGRGGLRPVDARRHIGVGRDGQIHQALGLFRRWALEGDANQVAQSVGTRKTQTFRDSHIYRIHGDHTRILRKGSPDQGVHASVTLVAFLIDPLGQLEAELSALQHLQLVLDGRSHPHPEVGDEQVRQIRARHGVPVSGFRDQYGAIALVNGQGHKRIGPSNERGHHRYSRHDPFVVEEEPEDLLQVDFVVVRIEFGRPALRSQVLPHVFAAVAAVGGGGTVVEVICHSRGG